MYLYEILALPEKARIDRVIAKKQFYDNAVLSATDKKIFDNVEKIYWRYALKWENSFIQPFRDKMQDYSEVEVLEVVLRSEKQLRHLAEIIIRAIPYPMLLFFCLEDKVQLYMGKLQQNQLDNAKMTLVSMEATDWLMEKDEFWSSMALDKLPTTDFCILYQAWFDMLSKSRLAALVPTEDMTGDEAREKMAILRALDARIVTLRNKMKKAGQFNQKMKINTELQKLKVEKKRILM